MIPTDLPHSLQVGTGSLAEDRAPTGEQDGGLTRLHVHATWGGSINLFGDLDAPLVESAAWDGTVRITIPTPDAGKNNDDAHVRFVKVKENRSSRATAAGWWRARWSAPATSWS